MPVPNVAVTKNPFALPSLPPSSDGILAIIASAQSGLSLTPQIWTSPNQMLSGQGYGPLTEYGAYVMNTSGRPVVGLRSSPSVAAIYGTITHTGTGTATATATAGTFPLEHYAVQVKFLQAGTLGTAGITYTYSLDGGNSVSVPQSLGTGVIIAIPNSGVSFTLAVTGTGTVIAGDAFSCFTERALCSDADVATELGILALSRQPWEAVLIDSNFGAASVGVIDGLLAGLEAQGQFKIALVNTRFKEEPEPVTEPETAYATAMSALLASQTSERMVVGADGGHVSSTLTGLNLKRPTALAAAAMMMSLTPNIGVDPAYVGNGPVPGYALADGNANPLDHDEDLYPTLDGFGFTTLRSFAPSGPQGVYITNANVISPENSNIRYVQQLRVLNKTCTIAWQLLTQLLSVGVQTQLNSATNTLNIQEGDAQRIEQYVTPQMESALQGQVSSVHGAPGVALTLSRTDNMGITPAIVTATVQVLGLVYIKGFAITVAFSKTISAAA